jgi:outer membrane biogenesis lipoprotein LolB
MTGTIKIINILLVLIVLLILTGCMKTTCVGPNKCDKEVDWNNPGFSIFRTIITNGTNIGN